MKLDSNLCGGLPVALRFSVLVLWVQARLSVYSANWRICVLDHSKKTLLQKLETWNSLTDLELHQHHNGSSLIL